MTWSETWSDILSGGSPRWKVTDVAAKQSALEHIVNNASSSGPLKIFCPLAGDDSFVHHAWGQGHDVTTIDLVAAAVGAMRAQFDDDKDTEGWTKEDANGSVRWSHSSGRAVLYEGDALQKRSELNGKFDAVYDKDSFGALPIDLRSAFCARLAEYVKPDGIVYIEVKNKEQGRDQGPPFHLEQDDLMKPEYFGSSFEHVKDLGEVYKLGMPGMKQTGHILKRK